MTQPTRLPAPGSGQPQHLSPIDWWAIGQGVGAIGSMIAQSNRNRAARQWQKRLDAARTAHVVEHRSKLAEASTAAEMAAWDANTARGGEWSYADTQAYDVMFRRWCRQNPTTYPSQDQHRTNGWLCHCDPNKGHTCSPLGIANSDWQEKQTATYQWGHTFKPRHNLKLRHWAPLLLVVIAVALLLTVVFGQTVTCTNDINAYDPEQGIGVVVDTEYKEVRVDGFDALSVADGEPCWKLERR